MVLIVLGVLLLVFVALTKGLIESGIPEEKADKMEANSKQRIESLMQSCGLAE